jgi:formate-nitrite transporter family protein
MARDLRGGASSTDRARVIVATATVSLMASGSRHAVSRPMTATSHPPPTDNQTDPKEREEKREAHERSAPTGNVVYEAIFEEGEAELSRQTGSLAWSGLAAGLSMGFSFVVDGLISAATPHAGWQVLISKLGYPTGFLIVVLARQQLFTENTLTVMLPLLRRRDARTLGDVGRLWTTVLAANLAGAVAFAFVIARTGVFPPDVHESFSRIAREGISAGFWTMMLRGVFAGWLIALMVWLLPYAETARFWVIAFIAYVVGIGHFPHVIAGSVDTMYLVATGQLGVGGFATRFLIPALLGNIIGGVSLVAALAHAQFVAHE